MLRIFSILFAAIGPMCLIEAGPDFQGPWQVVTARVLAILLPAAFAWFLWRAGSKRVTSTESTNGGGGGQ